MTKKEMFAMIATVNADNTEIVDFCNHEISLLESKKNSKGGLTKTQKENIPIMDAISVVLGGSDEPLTVTEIIASGDDLSGLTNQKVSALLRNMIKDGRVEKIVEKKKAYFKLV